MLPLKKIVNGYYVLWCVTRRAEEGQACTPNPATLLLSHNLISCEHKEDEYKHNAIESYLHLIHHI